MHPALGSTLNVVFAHHVNGPSYLGQLPAVSPAPAVVSHGWHQSFGTAGWAAAKAHGLCSPAELIQVVYRGDLGFTLAWLASSGTPAMRLVSASFPGYSKVCICQIALKAVMEKVRKWVSPLPNSYEHKSCRPVWCRALSKPGTFLCAPVFPGTVGCPR